MMSPEVAADAAEPLGVVSLTAVSLEALMPASDSCMVVAPSKELSLVPYETTVEPPEVAASAAEPSELSVVLNYELPICLVTVRETFSEIPAYPVTAMEAVCESSSYSVMALEAVCKFSSCEPSSCNVMAMEVNYELLSCPDPTEEAASER